MIDTEIVPLVASVLFVLPAHNQSTATGLVFEQSPVSSAAFLGDRGQFYCSITRGFLFWFVNDTFVSSILSNMYVNVVIHPNGMGENSTLQVLGSERTNNSQIQCAADTSGMIDQFSDIAMFLVQGVPLPPNNLSVQLAENSSAIHVSWQPPLAQIIDIGISYSINFSISSQNFTDHVSDITNNVTYVYDFEAEQCEGVYINVSVRAQNKVGKGNAIMKALLLNNDLCTVETHGVTCGEHLTTENTQNVNTVLPHQQTDAVWNCSNCNSTILVNDITQHGILNFIIGGVSGILLMVALMIIISICLWRMIVRGINSVVSGSEADVQLSMNPNEAYACILNKNQAYERISTLNSQALPTNQDLNLIQLPNNSIPLYEEVA